MKLSVCAASLLALAALGASAAAGAANLLVNGGFDGDMHGWIVNFGNNSSFGGYSASQGHDAPGTGYALVGFPGDDIFFRQCVNITAQNVDLVFYSHQTEGVGPNFGTGGVSFFDVPDCDGEYVAYAPVTLVETVTANRWKRQTLINAPAPAGTLSAMVILDNSVHAGEPQSRVDFDDVAFGPTGTFYTPPVTSNVLLNPDFAFDLSHWTVVAPATASSYTMFSATESYGGIGGSVGMMAAGEGNLAGVAQCVNMGSQRIDLEIFSKIILSATDNTGTASVSSYFSANCLGGVVDVATAPVVSTTSGWRRFLLENYALPDDIQSVKVAFTVAIRSPPGHDSTINVVADHFAFGPAGTFLVADRLFKNGFE